jgi:exopolyphosphatase/guanosine-5'-triphosphate,3'-diphosphate pyrophosphatase
LSESVAAVDLGSNSFHMIVARAADGRLSVLDRMKEMVRLADGLDDQNHITGPAAERAVGCLRRFGQRLRGIPPSHVRAVGTNTLRRARDVDDFLVRAEAALGHAIEVIAGREEARLIYLGVSHDLAPGQAQRLVLDIGGGSTELIIGRHYMPLETESLHIGCVGLSRRYFPDGKITRKRMRSAERAAQQEFETIREPFRQVGWDAAAGSSGTVLAAGRALRERGWSNSGLTLAGLRKLQEALVAAGRVDALRLPGVSRERAPVFPGGVAILATAFDALGIENMVTSSAALREGLLYDVLGRMAHEDAREVTVQELSRRYRIDPEQAERVRDTALALKEQAESSWGLERGRDTELLSWGAQLHEIGLAIAHDQYHKHGAYLLEHADMAGFSRQEQKLLAALVRAHRRKFPAGIFAGLPDPQGKRALRLAVLLRLAVVLHRSRTSTRVPAVTAQGQTLLLRFPAGWLEEHPLTEADLEQEAQYLKASGVALVVDAPHPQVNASSKAD